LNASAAVRAQRRHKELEAAGKIMPFEQVLCDIESRDAADYSRPVGALKKVRLPLYAVGKRCSDQHQVEGAVELDSSCMSFQQVVDAIIDIITHQTKDRAQQDKQ
jgi:cytidylate kinase